LIAWLADALGHSGLGRSEQVCHAILMNQRSFRLGLVIALSTGMLVLVTA